MIPTPSPFLRRAFIPTIHFARLSCRTCAQHGTLSRNALSTLAANNTKFTRPSAITQALTKSRLLSQSSVAPKSPSILQFISSSVWRATHRSGGSSRNGFRPPRPRGPWQRFRDAFNSIPNNVIFWSIMVINGCVYMSWQFAHAQYTGARDPSYILWMRDNFTTSMENFRAGRLWTLVTACFSHELTGHLFVNAFTFYFMAPPVLGALGNLGFLGLYLGGGIISSFVSLWWHARMNHPDMHSHGASGAIYSVVTFFACAAPRTTFYLFAIVPVPAWLCVSGLFAWDAYSAVTDKRIQTDSAGHVGGVLAGIAYFLAKALRVF
ncbi:hypothetical protein NM688_g9023 [Phlebia brevispora]|uniref:Uncharacterized protein n=1 Tax=Phlebia brevispora TaxID=194682 RepID=A0ACC1RMY2_9APHY|nr:hypothetical protein NM688_g9023 [Phlebia brevispora]